MAHIVLIPWVLMKAVLLIAGLFAASPAFGQTKVYTNADLGRPLSPNRVTVTPEQIGALARHQFVGVRVERVWDPVVGTGSSPTAGPFADYQQTIVPRRLDGSLWTEPQWMSVTYLGRRHYGAGPGSRHVGDRPRLRGRDEDRASRRPFFPPVR
jgi:hypothetical protein